MRWLSTAQRVCFTKKEVIKIIAGIWGNDKTAKTTLALTFPKPLVHMELDIGGFDRAKYRFKDDITNNLIIPKSYVMPYQTRPITPEVRPSKIIIGVKELWYKFLIDYIAFLEDDPTATIVVDTATLLWEIVCTAYLQEKQELQLDSNGNVLPNEKLRVSLLPIEYREPNIRMRGIIYQAKAHGKHLVLTHHSRDEFKAMPTKDGIVEQRTGYKERSGWGALGDGADIIVHTYLTNKVPYCKVELAEVLELVDIEFKEPTYDNIAVATKMIRGEE